VNIAAATYTDALSGAGIAAYRIHRAIASQGLDSALHVVRKRTNAADVRPIGGPWARRGQAVRAHVARAIFAALGERSDVMLSANLLPTGLHRRLDALRADLLHLHWLGAETIRIEELARLHTRVVWTLHDEWFYEGIDHYRPLDAGDGVMAPARRMLDRNVRRRKADAWKRLDPFVVAPSRWLTRNAIASGLVAPERVRTIPNPVPLDVYRPDKRWQAREALDLPQDHRVIGFGAVRAGMDPRKGYTFLAQALRSLAAEGSTSITLLVFGAERGSDPLPLPARFAGTVLSDPELARLYAAMDVFVCPSLQENFPNTIGEAMACGVPCAAFAVGGIPELIAHGSNGYVAAPRNADDLARGISACLAGGEAMGRAARAFAEATLAPSSCASAYAAVYAEALGARRSGP
jgi:glycosyltransferase involved in cell wall biosynthesis